MNYSKVLINNKKVKKYLSNRKNVVSNKYTTNMSHQCFTACIASALLMTGIGCSTWAGAASADPPFAQLGPINDERVNKFNQRVQSSTQATQELQNGLSKLQRICSQGNSTSVQQPKQASDLLASKIAKSELELASVQAAARNVVKDFSQNSRIAKYGACKYMPSFLPFACEGFRQDSALLDLAAQNAQKIITDARQRLYLYEQFAKLEDQGCARPGFTMKLWDTELTYLWPIVLQGPVALKTTLSYAPNH